MGAWDASGRDGVQTRLNRQSQVRDLPALDTLVSKYNATGGEVIVSLRACMHTGAVRK